MADFEAGPKVPDPKDILGDAMPPEAQKMSDIDEIDDILGYKKKPKESPEDKKKREEKEKDAEKAREAEEKAKEKRYADAVKLLNATADTSDIVNPLGKRENQVSEAKKTAAMNVYTKTYDVKLSEFDQDNPRPVRKLDTKIKESYKEMLYAIRDEIKNPEIVDKMADKSEAEQTAQALANLTKKEEIRKKTPTTVDKIAAEYAKHKKCASAIKNIYG